MVPRNARSVRSSRSNGPHGPRPPRPTGPTESGRSSGPGRAAPWQRSARRSWACGALACFWLALVSACGSGSSPPEPAALPNLLLISIDSLRSDHLGAYGYARPTSPRIDALAREGALFRSMVSASSWTLPAHMSLLTARPPEQHGVVKSNRRLRAEAITLAEVLRDRGYETIGVVAAPYLKAVYGYDQGFDVYDESVVQDGLGASHKGVTSPQLVERVAQFFSARAEAGSSRPFFLFLHMWDVHYDYAPPAPYDRLFDPDYAGTVTGDDFLLGKQVHPDMDPRDLEHVIALYDGEIRYTDDHIGTVVDDLRARGWLDDTIIAITADHGDEFFEHGRKGHGEALYDETLLVPLIIRYPHRIEAGLSIAEQVRTIDVAPTLLGLMGVAAPAGFGLDAASEHGARDLSPWLVKDAGAGAFPALLAHSETSMTVDEQRSVRSPAGKFITHSKPRKRPELYDLESDPGERADVFADRSAWPAPAAGLPDAAARWRKRWSQEEPLADTMALDPALEAGLRALGYIE